MSCQQPAPRSTYNIVDDSALGLMNRLHLLKPVCCARQAQCGRLLHETQLRIDVGLLLLVGERVPCLSLGLGLALALAIITTVVGSRNGRGGAGEDGQGGQQIGEQHRVLPWMSISRSAKDGVTKESKE